jgi:hypothetical protein
MSDVYDVPVLGDVMEAVDKLFGKMHSKMNEIRPMPTVSVLYSGSNKTDGNGNAEFQIGGNPVPDGKNFTVGRMVVIADGYTPANPWIGVSGASGSWFGIFKGRGQNLGTMSTFQPYPPNVLYLPALATFSSQNVLPFDGGDEIYFAINNGPVAVNITVLAHCWMSDSPLLVGA